jgi:pimeloyl-ACP methyl ester carboxylesterase
MTTPRADDWRSRGGYFSWRPAQGDASPVEIFHVEMGDPGASVLLLIHGWPTSSIDWFEVADQLSGRFRVCALDFPGYGFSDKPQGWGYSLARDEELIELYLSEIIGAEAAVVVAHDRGDSVALVHAAGCAEGRSATRLEHLVLSNGNIFLPLSNLTQVQRQALDAQSWSQVVAAVTPSMLAEGMGATTFIPPRRPSDPEVEALTATFAYDDGIKVLHEGNQYLMFKPGGNRLYFIPDANHYLQVDRPDAFAKVLLHALEPPGGQAPGALEAGLGAPLLVDTSRERLPAAADVLRA